jgi:hypothetical protein
MYMFETTEKFRQMRENVPKFCGIEMYKNQFSWILSNECKIRKIHFC